MGGISTHVLDTTTGAPAAGLVVELHGPDGARLARASTDADGRIAALASDELDSGVHHVRFLTGDHHAARGVESLHPEVVVAVRVEAGEKLHVPLLLSPFAYTTYRGS